ncbi:MAG TPA: response regulator [Bryobacteraceae bacterium]|nr:response regulator [Bryobacteraceae bacterium]
MTQTDGVVYLVDDDPRVREALSELLASLKIEHVTFGSAAEYLAFERSEACACLVLDVRLPDINGLDLQRQLADESCPPIVFISGHGDVPSTVRAMKAGAIEFLTKPINVEAFVTAIRAAFAQDLEHRHRVAGMESLQRRHDLLTPREREVFPLIAAGMLNKQAAAILGITEVTLQVHRGQIMKKMEAESFADLVRMAAKLGIPGPDRTL